MKTDLPFEALGPGGPEVRIVLDGQEMRLPEGMMLAAALLLVNAGPLRKTPVSGAPRGPFCMMGACFECLVEIEGVTRQACMVAVTDGLVVRRKGGGDGRH